MGNDKNHLHEMTVKEAIGADVGNIIFRSTVLIDPAPPPFIPIAPLVVGAKVLHETKKTIVTIGRKLLG